MPIKGILTTPYFSTLTFVQSQRDLALFWMNCRYSTIGQLAMGGLVVADAPHYAASFFAQCSFLSDPCCDSPRTRLRSGNMDPFCLGHQNRPYVVVSGPAPTAPPLLSKHHLQLLCPCPLHIESLQLRPICPRWRSFPSSGSAERLETVPGEMVVGAAAVAVAVADWEGVAAETQNH